MKTSFRFISWPVVATAFVIACSAKPPKPGEDGGGDDAAGVGGFSSDDLDGGSGGFGSGDDEFVPPDDSPPDENCGDGLLGDGVSAKREACDDGNQMSGDGCGNNCRYVEPGFICRDAGVPCGRYALCGDGIVAFPEQCDDGGVAPGDGCSAVCKFEIGYTCEGAKSTCRLTVCGDGKQEGSETCEAADGAPFDGCSTTCQGEPACTDMGCTSKCGDGLVIGAEECDDGNATPGDGCSAECKNEPGYTCTSAAPCTGPECTLKLPIVFRDFNESHADFWPPYKDGDMDGYAPGIVADKLDANGKPVYASSPTLSHVTSAATFNEWYNNVPNTNAMIVGEITLYDDAKGGYVNRFGPNGEQFMATVDPHNCGATKKDACERQAGGSLAAATTQCQAWARDAQEMFQGKATLRCDDKCRQLAQDAQQLRDNTLNQLNNQLMQAENATPPDEEKIADLEEQIAAVEVQIDEALAAADTCKTDCESELAKRTADCVGQLIPCSSDATKLCYGTTQEALDGDPLFFPIDDAPGILKDTRGGAKIPAQIYHGLGWPWEGGGTGETAPAGSPMHNFHFTSEIAYWFKYNTGMAAEFTFIGDDDVFVFVNRRLLIDLGGIHVPLAGRFTIAANGSVTYSTWQPPDAGEGETANTPLKNGMTTLNALGISDGGVYEIKVFHAERKPEGSSFQLTMAGFNATRSVCLPECGDGIIAAGEQCDDGKDGNVGGFNRCNANCTLGAFCGDGIVQQADGEECDDNDPNGPADCFGCRNIIFE